MQIQRNTWMEIKTAMHKLEGFWDAFLLAAVNSHLPSDEIRAERDSNGIVKIVCFNKDSEWHNRAIRFYEVCRRLAMANSVFIGYITREGEGNIPRRYQSIGMYMQSQQPKQPALN